VRGHPFLDEEIGLAIRWHAHFLALGFLELLDIAPPLDGDLALWCLLWGSNAGNPGSGRLTIELLSRRRIR